MSFVIRQAVAALHEALDNMEPGEIFSGLTANQRLSFNRRYWMKNGTVVTNPSKLNPDIEQPEGKTDNDIPLIGIRNNGQWRVIIANIVNHTDTIGGCNVSADWPGFMIRKLRKEIGVNSMVFPLIGCSGNINHFDVTTDKNQTCYAEAERIGNEYAKTVSQALETLQALPYGAMTVKSCRVICGPREISSQELNDAIATLKKYENIIFPENCEIAFTSEDLARKTPPVLKYFAKKLIEATQNRTNRTFNLVRVSFDSVCIVSLPCEPFVEIGLEIKKKIFPDQLTLVVSLANGTGSTHENGGYIPNSYNYGRGGYETSPLANPLSFKTAALLLNGIKELK